MESTSRSLTGGLLMTEHLAMPGAAPRLDGAGPESSSSGKSRRVGHFRDSVLVTVIRPGTVRISEALRRDGTSTEGCAVGRRPQGPLHLSGPQSPTPFVFAVCVSLVLDWRNPRQVPRETAETLRRTEAWRLDAGDLAGQVLVASPDVEDLARAAFRLQLRHTVQVHLMVGQTVLTRS